MEMHQVSPLIRPTIALPFVLIGSPRATAAYLCAKELHEAAGDLQLPHLVAGAEIVARVSHTDAMLAASFLYRSAEDHGVSAFDISDEFGADVGSLVNWVSLSPDIGFAPNSAKTIKLAILLVVLKHLPQTQWKRDAARARVSELGKLLLPLKGGDATLWEEASQAVLRATWSLC